MFNGLHLPWDQSKESGLHQQQAGCRLDRRWGFQVEEYKIPNVGRRKIASELLSGLQGRDGQSARSRKE